MPALPTISGPNPRIAYNKYGQSLYTMYNMPGFKEYQDRAIQDLQDAVRRGGNTELRKLAESDPDKYGSLSVGFYTSQNTATTNQGRFADIPEYDSEWYNAQMANPWAYDPSSVHWGGKLDPYLEALHTAFNNAKNMSDPNAAPSEAVAAAPVTTTGVQAVPTEAPAATGGIAAEGNAGLTLNDAGYVDLELASQIAEQEKARQQALASGSSLLGTTDNTLGS